MHITIVLVLSIIQLTTWFIVSRPHITELLKQLWDIGAAVVCSAHSHHDEVFVGIDIKRLRADAERIIAWILRFREAFVAQIIPIEMIAAVAGVVFRNTVDPCLAYNAFAVPHSIVEIE